MFDFSGTGHEVFGNLNAPRAITLSALIYCLRCLVGRDIPLNQVRCWGDCSVREVSGVTPGREAAQQPSDDGLILEVLEGEDVLSLWPVIAGPSPTGVSGAGARRDS